MKVVITDYPNSMMPIHDYEKEILESGLDNVKVVVYEYHDEKRGEFFEVIKDADAILTGFTKIDAVAMDHAKNLKVISMNATGYDNVDLEEANKRGIGVCPVGEYCTKDVAEFTISTMFMLVKNLKDYIIDVEKNYKWRYDYAEPDVRVEQLTYGIIGFGRIGTAVGKIARALGMKVVAHDPFIDQNKGKEFGIELLIDKKDIFEQADIISNHMNLNESNYDYFDKAAFESMKRKPYFINMGRGACVVEEALITALNKGILKGAAVDVLRDETPDLSTHSLVGRNNVLVTPHAAFYTQTSIRELQRISTENIVHYLNGDKDKVFKLVSNN